MEETPVTEPASAPAAEEKPKSEWRELATFLVKLVLIVAIVRSFIFSPFSIPSESMLPRLLIGDYLFITKFNYGYSRHSLPFSLPLLPHIQWADPAPGDVVVLKAPPANNVDWIKRVIALPGDTVQMRNGQVILNAKEVPKVAIAPFVLPISPNFPAGKCMPDFLGVDDKGQQICSIPRFRETLPNGKSYEVLDQRVAAYDDTDVYTVPKGHVFLMGDNRDNSADSRFPQTSDPDTTGLAYVPMENIEGKAVISFWSTDGSANWFLPWTWFTAARWDRLGRGF